MSTGDRLVALREMVAAEPSDALAQLLLGRELLAHGLHEDAARHLALHLSLEDEGADRGAAYGALAECLAALGRGAGAREALDAGIASARAHRHLGLVATLEEQRSDLPA